ncbi:MAG: AMP-binding protein [Dehalococcoidia bacterium]
MMFEQWIHRKVRQAFEEDAGYRRFRGTDSLDEGTRRDIQSLQLYRLKQTLNYAAANSPFYRDLLEASAEIESLEDLPRIPFTNPLDLEQSPYKLLCTSIGGIARTFSHFTTGTMSGRPKKIFFTYNDADAIVDSMAAIMETVTSGAGFEAEGSKIHIFLPANGPPMSMAGLISRGAKQLGAVPIVGDCTAMTGEQIAQVAEEKPHLLMGSAFRIWRLTQEARETHDLANMGVKAVLITSEYLSRPMRQQLEHCWGAEVFHHYGMTEPGFAIGVECSAHDGFHFNETQLLFEVVDPDTGQLLEDGEEGELVFTTLQRDGMPLIRYRTGDVACLKREPCGCGAETLTRIGTLPKRVGLILDIGEGEQIYTSLFDEALYQIPELIDYRVFISRDGDIDLMNCMVEVLGKPPDIEERVLKEALTIPAVRKSVEAGLLAQPTVELVERGVLRRGGRRMKRRIVDQR